MEKNFNGSINRGKRARGMMSTLAISLGLGLSASSNALVFGQQVAETSPASAVKMAENTKPTLSNSLASPKELSRSFVSVAKQVKPAVVNINIVEKAKKPAMGDSDGFPPDFGFP